MNTVNILKHYSNWTHKELTERIDDLRHRITNGRWRGTPKNELLRPEWFKKLVEKEQQIADFNLALLAAGERWLTEDEELEQVIEAALHDAPTSDDKEALLGPMEAESLRR